MATVPDLSGNTPADAPPIINPTIYSKMKFDNTGNLLVSSGAGAGAGQVQGNVAANVVDTGNPVKVGGYVSTTSGTQADGTRGDLQLDSRMNLKTTIFSVGGVTGAQVMSTAADAASNGIAGLSVYAAGRVFNGTTWDRARGDTTAAFTKAPPLAGTDRSITASTTSQQLVAANTTRSKIYIKNDTAIVVWINVGATAVASAGGGNIAIAANGGYWEFTGSSSAINIIAASATPAITAREF